ncbi:MAG: hypothetical protein BGO25_05760 [Acidobacteriales bacterium 59-55]|nr:MAG: hypothetical protein ABT04_02535 [Granulicella sp. SCN 62-9]OJV44589.1 MAG: hypothetical protein BGO25_05760 [Acidobacteriales bacterium 59-55]
MLVELEAEETVTGDVLVRRFAEGVFVGGDAHLLVEDAHQYKRVVVTVGRDAAGKQQPEEVARHNEAAAVGRVLFFDQLAEVGAELLECLHCLPSNFQ